MAPALSPTLLFTNYECCKTEHNDRDQAGPIFAALSTVSLMRIRGPPLLLVGFERALGILRIDRHSSTLEMSYAILLPLLAISSMKGHGSN